LKIFNATATHRAPSLNRSLIQGWETTNADPGRKPATEQLNEMGKKRPSTEMDKKCQGTTSQLAEKLDGATIREGFVTRARLQPGHNCNKTIVGFSP